jgi:hypothetical protein
MEFKLSLSIILRVKRLFVVNTLSKEGGGDYISSFLWRKSFKDYPKLHVLSTSWVPCFSLLIFWEEKVWDDDDDYSHESWIQIVSFFRIQRFFAIEFECESSASSSCVTSFFWQIRDERLDERRQEVTDLTAKPASVISPQELQTFFAVQCFLE